METITSVGEKLLHEIVRVSAKRERWIGYAKDDPDTDRSFAVAIALRSRDIDAAKSALLGDDPVAVAYALFSLAGYSNDD